MLPKVFRKTPLAWLQVTRERTRLAVAIAGITFADILMFLQLGFKDALFNAAVKPYEAFNTDLVLVNPQFETLFAVKSFSRERLYQAAGVSGVKSVNSLYISVAQWRNLADPNQKPQPKEESAKEIDERPNPQMERPILVFGTDPGQPAFNLPEVNRHLHELKMLNRILFDQAGRPEYGPIATLLQQEKVLPVQLNNLDVRVTGVFTLGASFTADGNVITSISTFLRLFPNRKSDEIDVGFITLKPGADIQQVKNTLEKVFEPNNKKQPLEVLVLTLDEFAEREKEYWGNATPIGFIFGFGTVIGFIVGIVIVYQILYSDVSDHLPEYATLKAMGYADSYLIGVLIQEAFILAILGFLPGCVLATGLYYLANSATMLPIVMTLDRATLVLVLNLVMCVGSGLIAMRKLQAADPADIFS